MSSRVLLLALAIVAVVVWLIVQRRAPPPPAPPALSAPLPASSEYRYSQPILPTVKDLAYADQSPAQKLDLYLPAPGKVPAPLVIWIHGGGFRVGDKRSMPRRNFGPPPVQTSPDGPFQIQVPDVTALTAKGYAVVSLNYRLLGVLGRQSKGPVEAAFQDAKAAVRFLRANAGKYRLDPDKFAVWGNSAGGWMAAMLGVTGDQPTPFDDPDASRNQISSAVQAVVVWYGAVGEERLPAEIRVSHYLPTALTVPPFLIANGDADQNVPVAGAQWLQTALVKAGVSSSFTVIPGARHEDPAFMLTQMLPTFAFLDKTFGR